MSSGSGTGLRLQVEMAADQSSIVMKWAAEQQEIQRCPTTTLRQRPATDDIEQIPLMHQHAIHPGRTCSAHQLNTSRARQDELSHQPSASSTAAQAAATVGLLARSAAHAWPSPADGSSPGFIKKNTSLDGT